ncbi:MAG: HAD-IA family hydrolase [Syntrophales bacterium]
MKQINLMIFDFDGTLVNSGGDIAASVNYTLENLGIPAMEPEVIIDFVGDGVKKLIERSLGHDCQDQFDEAMKIFTAYYSEHILDTTTFYPGVTDILQHFQDKKKVIITNKRYSFTKTIAEALDMEKYFDDIIGEDSTPYKKPDLRLLSPLMERFGAGCDQTVVIGDGINDILLAKNTGVLSCAFLNGLGHRDILLAQRPDFIYESLLELRSLFC